MARRRKARVPKVVDRPMVAFIVAGVTWMLLTSHFVGCPHSLALVTSCVAGGTVLGMYARRPVLRIGPMRITFGTARRRPASRSRGRRR